MANSLRVAGKSIKQDDLRLKTDRCLQLVPAMVLVSFLHLVPESPRWLLLKDRHEEALESLRRYLGKGLRIDDDIVQDEYKSIVGALEIERMSKISFKEVMLCRDRSSHLKRMLLGMGTQFMQVSQIKMHSEVFH
jgi:hypothetical protein